MKFKRTGNTKTTGAYQVSANGYSFTVIYGQYCGSGFIAIPNWGVCVEAGQPSDVFYNKENLSNCNNETVASNSEDIAIAISEFIKEEC